MLKTKGKPRVSIGIPVYNGEPYLAETIDSILAQTYKDFELIISDNASTDRTEEICRDYAAADGRIRYWRNPRNLGAARNFNDVFKRSSGEYFKWSAADNLIEPAFLDRCVAALDTDPRAVLAYTKCLQINNFNNTMRKIETERDLSSPNAYERLRKLFLQVIGMQDTIWGLIRSDALQRTHLIRPFIGADDCLLIELVLQGAFVEVPERLLVLRIHPGGYHAIDRRGRWWNAEKTSLRHFNRLRIEGKKQARWYDPRNNAVAYFPHWRRLREYFLLIMQARVRFGQKVRMLEFLCHLVSWMRTRLAAELWNGVAQILHLNRDAV